MKRTLSLSAAALVLSAVSLARAETLLPTNDSHVRNDGSGPYGDETQIFVKDNGAGFTGNRIGLVRFAYDDTAPVLSATLKLTISDYANYTNSHLDGHFKFCWHDVLNGNHCDSTSGSVTVNGSGQVKICGNVPGGSTKCDTLS